MSLQTNLQDLATRIATECKAIKTLMNGNALDLSALNTTTKLNLVAAINEVLLAAGGVTDLSLGTNNATSVQIVSSTGQNVTISAATTLLAGLMAGADKSKLNGIAAGATINAADAVLLARANHTGTQPASTISDFNTAVNDLIQNVIGAAPGALNTLVELAAALGDDANFSATVNAALTYRLRFDAAQTLSGPQQAQAQANLSVYSRTELGDPTKNFVIVFETGLA
jgi:hypothetical protein